MVLRRAAILLLLGLGAADVPRDVFGDWLTADSSGVIRVAACGPAICGTIAGVVVTQGAPPPQTWQGTPQCGFPLLTGLHPGDDGRLHGTVTNPETGRRYDADLWRGADGALRLRGYIGLPLLGSTERWPAFHGHVGAGCRFTF